MIVDHSRELGVRAGKTLLRSGLRNVPSHWEKELQRREQYQAKDKKQLEEMMRSARRAEYRFFGKAVFHPDRKSRNSRLFRLSVCKVLAYASY
jgi:hypothetical protein